MFSSPHQPEYFGHDHLLEMLSVMMNSTHMGACGEFTSGTTHIFLAAGMDAFSCATKSV
jgi:hypothetical protein